MAQPVPRSRSAVPAGLPAALPGQARPGQARPELAKPPVPAGSRMALREPCPAGPTTVPPAPTASARRPPQMSSREKETCSSYFSPVADQVVIDAGQFDRFRVVSSKPLNQGLDRGIEIED